MSVPVSQSDTRLLEVSERRRFRTPADFARLLPPHLTSSA